MLKRIRPLMMLLAPLLGMTIFCAAQSGLQMVRPDGLAIKISPRTTADYGPWPADHFQPVDPALSTVVAQDGDPTQVIINTPNPNIAPTNVNIPTTDPRTVISATPTLALAPPITRPSVVPSPVASATLIPAATYTPDPTDTPNPSSTPGKFKPTRKPRIKPSPGKGNGNGGGNGNGNSNGKGK